MRGKREAGRPPEHSSDAERPRRRAPVFVYLAVLFIAAFLMLLLAYFMQMRSEELAGPVSHETQELLRPAAANDHISAIIS